TTSGTTSTPPPRQQEPTGHQSPGSSGSGTSAAQERLSRSARRTARSPPHERADDAHTLAPRPVGSRTADQRPRPAETVPDLPRPERPPGHRAGRRNLHRPAAPERQRAHHRRAGRGHRVHRDVGPVRPHDPGRSTAEPAVAHGMTKAPPGRTGAGPSPHRPATPAPPSPSSPCPPPHPHPSTPTHRSTSPSTASCNPPPTTAHTPP